MTEQDLEEVKDEVIRHLLTMGFEINKSNIQECVYGSYHGDRSILDQIVEYIVTNI